MGVNLRFPNTMKLKKLLALAFIASFLISLSACSSAKSCSTKSKTKVNMGYM